MSKTIAELRKIFKEFRKMGVNSIVIIVAIIAAILIFAKTPDWA